MANETITIECLEDGTYRVTSTEDDTSDKGDLPLDETVSTVEEVLGLVKRELGDDYEEQPGDAEDDMIPSDEPSQAAAAPKNPKAAGQKMWNEEAAKRNSNRM